MTAATEADAALISLGVTPELAEPVGAGLRELMRLRDALRDTAAEMIRAELAGHDRRLMAAAEGLAAKAEAAMQAAEAAEAHRAAIAAQVQECQAEAAELAASPQLRDPDKVARRAAILERAQAEEDLAERQAELAEAAAAARELDEQVGPVLAEAAKLAAERAVLAAAAEDPFSSPLGHRTLGYRAWLAFSSLAFAPLSGGDLAHPEYWPAYDHLMRLLRLSGIGPDIERRVEAHFADATSPVKHTADGIPFVPGGLTQEEAALFANRAATRQQGDPVPSGREASEWIRQGTGAQLAPGIPGVSASDLR